MFWLDHKNLAIIGGITAAVLAGVYVVWGPTENRIRKKNRKVICPGLVNLGNSCFLNAVLQALAPCTSFAQWLTNIVDRRRLSSHNLAPTLQNAIKVLNNDSFEFTDEFCPSDVIQTLQGRGWIISSDEQDAHEMFHVLTETLSEETTPGSRVLPLFDVTGLEETGVLPKREAVNRIGVDTPVLERSDADNVFYGLLASQLQCRRCGHKCAIKYDSFDSLSLSLPSKYSGPQTLEQLLRRFVMLESIDDVVCEKCTADSLRSMVAFSGNQSSEDKLKRSSFIKKLTIGKMPRCLCVHIQRTVWMDSGVPMKRCDAVSFPEILDMSPYTYQNYPTSKMRPNTLNIDTNVRLVGGRQGEVPLDWNKSSSSKPSPTSASRTPMLSPNSGQVNMLKALNYRSRVGLSGDGLYTASRSGSGSGVPSKSASAADHELQMLAAAYSAENALPMSCNYKLVSVICHLGDVMSGHFVAYRRAPSLSGRRFPDEWLYTSDLLVRRAPIGEVLAASAYMLMYEKI